jgi:hypothetical protein
MDTVTACSIDRTARKTTCATRFKDTRGIPTTYNTSRTQTTTSASQGQAVNCTATFDVNGNAVASSCLGTLSGSKTTITANEKICR